MKALALLLLTALSLQGATLAVSNAQALPGAIATIPLTFQGTEQVSGLQFTVPYPVNEVEGLTAQPSPELLQLGKSITCLTDQGETRCLVIGLNQTAIPSGTVIGSLVVDTSEAFDGIEVSLVDLAATDPGGTSVPLTSTPGMLDLGSGPCDINRDGLTNIVDVQLVVNASLQPGTCGPQS